VLFFLLRVVFHTRVIVYKTKFIMGVLLDQSHDFDMYREEIRRLGFLNRAICGFEHKGTNSEERNSCVKGWSLLNYLSFSWSLNARARMGSIVLIILGLWYI